jgi:hypothetical protein
MQCRASAILPAIHEEGEWAAKGHKVHASVLPKVDPASLAYEVAFVYDALKGTAKEVGRDIGRSYPALAHFELAGTADLVGMTEDSVVILDLKSGYGRLPAPGDHWQLRILGLMAARAYGRTHARLGLMFQHDEDDEPRYEFGEADAFDLSDTAEAVKETAIRLDTERALYLNGLIPDVTPGEHCKYCPAFSGCPAKVGLLRTLASDPDLAMSSLLSSLSPEKAPDVYWKVQEYDALFKKVKEALHSYAWNHPIQLGNGEVYGPAPGNETIRDHDQAKAALVEVSGVESVEVCGTTTWKTSKGAIEKALGKPTAERVFALMREGGALASSPTVRRHKPKGER